ncbi:Cytoplasmic GTPase/eEF2-like protein (ribosomal biogenesis) [Gonapodya sp. JEL0774]|nr:Cytoplasmic GTPase/eEF2-like protein (ribosomal biogenesis) [Gonapodya sp. JEL0774]
MVSPLQYSVRHLTLHAPQPLRLDSITILTDSLALFPLCRTFSVFEIPRGRGVESEGYTWTGEIELRDIVRRRWPDAERIGGYVFAREEVRAMGDQTNVRNLCILAHVDHGKTTLSDRLIATNGIISSKLAGKIRYLDSREDEQIRGITMKSSGISLYFKVVSGVAGKEQKETTTVDNGSVEGDAGANPPPPPPPAPPMREFLINLIDSPGHVDFSSEVSTASRLCDGALVLVDVVEGVQTQTHTVLRQAWEETLRPVLVLNKIDRLVTELKMTTVEAAARLAQIVERVNAIVGGFFQAEKQKRMNRKAGWESFGPGDLIAGEGDHSDGNNKQNEREAVENGSGNDTEDDYVEDADEDDTDLYFSPEQGNVVFASATDGWAFRLSHFSRLYASRLKLNERHLLRHLWGDFYLDPKTRRVLSPRHLRGRQLKPMFAQFVLDNVWAVYDAVLVNHDRDRISKIAASLNLKLSPRDLASKDHRSLAQTLFSQWLPLSSAVLLAAVQLVPDPRTAQRLRMPPLLGTATESVSTALMAYGVAGKELELPPVPASASRLERAVCECDDGPESPVVVYVSKMFHVPRSMIVEGKQAEAGTADELRERRREIAKRREMAERAESGDGVSAAGNEIILPEDSRTEEKGDAVVAFARVFSGTLRAGQTVFVLGPKYNPRKPNSAHYTKVTVGSLYLMMGRELQELDSVPAGNICGIGGLDAVVLKTATLSTSLDCPSLGQLKIAAQPILRVAVEPTVPGRDSMAKLEEGLRILNQADPVVEVLVQETGEHIIVAAGELHLERCLKDLKERYAKIAIRASAPIVPFRETIAPIPAVQYGLQVTQTDKKAENSENAPVIRSIVELRGLKRRKADVANRHLSDKESAQDLEASLLEGLRKEMDTAYLEGKVVGGMERESWLALVDTLWSFGPRKIGANMLVNQVKGYNRRTWTNSLDSSVKKRNIFMRAQELTSSSVHESETVSQAESNDTDEPQQGVGLEAITAASNSEYQKDEELHLGMGDVAENKLGHTQSELGIKDFEGNLETGFQLAALSGPLCAEPMTGCCFILEEFKVASIGTDAEGSRKIALGGHVISTMKESCRQAFLQWSPRLALAMYSCEIQSNAEVLGKVYAVIAKRRGRILSEELQEDTSSDIFTIKATLPIFESFGFADDLRKRTSGAANPQLIFSGYEVLDQDPFWVPTTEEELEDLGEKAERENLARRYMDGVRSRKDNSLDQELYQKERKVIAADGSTRTVATKYRDSLPPLNHGERFADNDESFVADPSLLGDRQVYYAVSVPCETEWVRQGYKENSLEKRNTRTTDSELLAKKYPLGRAAHTAAIALVYDDTQLKYNDTVEFIGVIGGLNSKEDAGDANAEEGHGDYDEWGVVLPRVPRLHVILARPLAFLGNPSLQLPFDLHAELSKLNISTIRTKLLQRLAHACNGDNLAAEYVLIALVSRIYFRDSMPLGAMHLRLVSPDGLPRLRPLLEMLVPRLHSISLTISELNSKSYLPSISERHGLLSGELQLAAGTVLLIDETKLEEGGVRPLPVVPHDQLISSHPKLWVISGFHSGQVKGRGVLNIHGLKQIREFSKVPVGIRPRTETEDGEEVSDSWMEQEADLPLIVVGSTISGIVMADTIIPIVPERMPEDLSSELKNLSIEDEDKLFELWRKYLSIAREADYSTPDDMSKVNKERAADVPSPGQDSNKMQTFQVTLFEPWNAASYSRNMATYESTGTIQAATPRGENYGEDRIDEICVMLY